MVPKDEYQKFSQNSIYVIHWQRSTDADLPHLHIAVLALLPNFRNSIETITMLVQKKQVLYVSLYLKYQRRILIQFFFLKKKQVCNEV